MEESIIHVHFPFSIFTFTLHLDFISRIMMFWRLFLDWIIVRALRLEDLQASL